MGVQITNDLDFNNGSLKIGDLTQPFSAYENTFRSYDLQNYSWQNCPLTWAQCIKTWNMAGETVFTIDVTETAAIAEKLTKTIKLKRREALNLAERIARTLAKEIADAVRFTETYYDYIKFNLSFGESVSVTDKPYKTIAKPFGEAFAITERKVLRNMRKAVKEAFDIDDVMRQMVYYHLSFSEAAGITDAHANTINKAMFETVDVTELTPQKLVTLAKFESAQLTDVMTRTVNFLRRIGEGITTTDALDKTVELLKKEDAALYDAIIEASGAVISNIAIAEGNISLAGFEEAVQKPPGYSAFMDFKVGEYEYKEALVRIVIKAVAAQTQPSVTNVVMHVDIPDTQDRGTAEITDTSAVTRINFTKLFYTTPEVNVNLRGGNTGDGLVTPYITAIDTTGFEVQLLNADGARVTGLITWQATGY